MELLRTNPPLPTSTQAAYAVRHASLGLREVAPETLSEGRLVCAPCYTALCEALNTKSRLLQPTARLRSGARSRQLA